MVVLVRCSNKTYSLALEARVDELVQAGIVEAVLRDDEWVPVRPATARREEMIDNGARKRLPLTYAAA